MPRDTRSCRGSGTAMVIGLRLLYRGFGRLRRGGRVRSKAPHSKCGNPQGFGGSNPFLSAISDPDTEKVPGDTLSNA